VPLRSNCEIVLHAARPKSSSVSAEYTVYRVISVWLAETVARIIGHPSPALCASTVPILTGPHPLKCVAQKRLGVDMVGCAVERTRHLARRKPSRQRLTHSAVASHYDEPGPPIRARPISKGRDDPLRRLLADARNARDQRDILCGDGPCKIVRAEGKLAARPRTDPGPEKPFERAPLGDARNRI
jgi:hypothetical protein